MPLTFEELADAGLINTARGIINRRFRNAPLEQRGPIWASVIERIRAVAPNPDDIDYESARSVARRAFTSITGARRLGLEDRPLSRNQHGFDPSFSGKTSKAYVYRTIVKCIDEANGQEVRIPVDVESDTRLTSKQIEKEAITAYAKGKTVLKGSKSDYPTEGSCVDPIVILVFAVRTT